MVMKETLEKAAENFLIRQGCQRMDCDGEHCNFFEDVQPKDLIEFAKWQMERMYSEEDMIEFAFNTYHYISELMGVPFNLMSENKLHAMYNFEHFKKK
jgi:hypothetical protein